MRRTIMVLAGSAICLGAVALTAVGSKDAPDQRVRGGTAAGTWQTAHEQVTSLNAATFDLSIANTRCDATRIDESCHLVTYRITDEGSFSLEPSIFESERVIERPGSEAGQLDISTAKLRWLPDGSGYYQDDLLGPGSCWQSEIDYTLIELTEEPLFASLDVLRSARVIDDPELSGQPVELPALADALPVLRVLGMAEHRDEQDRVDDAMKRFLATRSVPLTVLVDQQGAPAGLRIEGHAVAAALETGEQLSTSNFYLALAQGTDVELRLGDINQVPDVAAPPPEQIRRPGDSEPTGCGSGR